jgi:hypothetical protein
VVQDKLLPEGTYFITEEVFSVYTSTEIYRALKFLKQFRKMGTFVM